MKKLLALLGSLTMVGTAGATVVACDNGKSETPESSPKERLKKQIEDAKSVLDSETGKQKSESARKELNEAIDAAQKVFDDGNNDEAFNEATNKLNEAVNVFNKSENVEDVDVSVLENRIVEAEFALENFVDKSDAAKDTLKVAIAVARAVLDNPVSQKAVDNAANTLKEATETFVESNSEEGINTKELTKEISKALKVLAESSNKSEDAKEKLMNAILVAQNILSEAKDQNEVDQAVITLTDAIDEFNKTNGNGKDDLYWDLVDTVAKVNLKLENLLNLDDSDSFVELIRELVKQAKDITIDSSLEDIQYAITNLEKGLARLQEADKTDFSSFDKAVKKYKDLELVNEPKVGLIPKIEAKISDFRSEIDSNIETIKTIRIEAMGDVLNPLINELIDYDFDLSKEINELKPVIDSASELKDVTFKKWDEDKSNTKLAKISRDAEGIFDEMWSFEQKLENSKTEEKALDKKEIQKQIDEFKLELESHKNEYNEYVKPKLSEMINKAQQLLEKNKNAEKEAKEALEVAIDAAQKVFDDLNINSDEEINNAVAALETAIQIFEDAINPTN